VLTQQRPALAFGHPAPDTELDAVVEGIGAALKLHGTVAADGRGFALGGAADEQLIRVDPPTPCTGHPSQSSFRVCNRR